VLLIGLPFSLNREKLLIVKLLTVNPYTSRPEGIAVWRSGRICRFGAGELYQAPSSPIPHRPL
jgi:hypothetical protein